MDYLLKANGVVIILFLFYFVFLKNETFFNSIRSYFLVGLLIVIAIPLVEIPVYVEVVSRQFTNLNYTEITSATISKESINWVQILSIIYVIGVVFFSVKFILQLLSLVYLISKHELIKKGNYWFIETAKDVSPFSFFNIIIYNKSHFSMEELEQIIHHEKAHATQWHSIDTILAHFLVITMWFNPFVWLYKKATQQNLEFLADAYAVQQINNQKLYQFTLLKTCNSTYCTQITNNFYNSLIKKRIIMLHKNRSKNKRQLKYLLLLPILFTFVTTFNTKVIAQEKKWIEVEQSQLDLIIDKNSTDADLAKETATFKNELGIALSFKKIKRNSKNEITAIKIEAKDKNIKAKFENSGNEPIKPIKISYNSNGNSISIGNVSEVHENYFAYTIGEKDKVKFNGKTKDTYVFVTSDGKTTSWTSKNDSLVHKKIMIIKSNGDDNNNNEKHIWIQKSDTDSLVEIIELNGKKTPIKTTENGIEKEITIKIIEDKDSLFINSDNASENIFIVKKNTDELPNHNNSNGLFIGNNSKEKPLIIIDGKETSMENLEKLAPDSIEKMEVLKGEKATKKYGEKGRNGVILITTKQ